MQLVGLEKRDYFSILAIITFLDKLGQELIVLRTIAEIITNVISQSLFA